MGADLHGARRCRRMTSAPISRSGSRPSCRRSTAAAEAAAPGAGPPAPRRRRAPWRRRRPAPSSWPPPVRALRQASSRLVCSADSFCVAGEAQPGGLGREAEELLRQHLKRRHAASILSLKEEFMRKRKKGKLPKDATTSLKTWWTANLVWPYPSVRACATLHARSGPAADEAVPFSASRTRTSASWATTPASTPRRSTTVRRVLVSEPGVCGLTRLAYRYRVHQPAQAPLAQGALPKARGAFRIVC